MSTAEDIFALASADADKGVGEDKRPEVSLSALQKKGEEMREAEAEVVRLEAELKLARAKFEKIATLDLPSLMIEAKMKNFEMDDGSKVKLDKVYAANIKADNKPITFKWLRDNQHHGIIKTDVVLPFGKGTDTETLTKAAAKLTELGFAPEIEESVHWATLRAFVKEQVEDELKNPPEDESKKFPRELFSVHIIDKVSIKPAKD